MSFLDNKKTFRPQKKHKKGQQETMHNFVKKTLSTLGTGSMQQAVQLPSGECINEWIAVNTLDFYNEINLLYGAIQGFCTDQSCPKMSAGSKYNYLWADGVKVKKPISVSASKYIDLLLVWVESQLNDESLFPIEYDSPYPKNFMKVVKTIYKRYFRVYAHIYHSHLKEVETCGAGAHLNTCFKHLMYFINEFKLIDNPKQELAPLGSLIKAIIKTDDDDEKKS